MKRLFLIGLILFPTLFGCRTDMLSDRFTLNREWISGNTLRLDGYYYSENFNYISVIFLYRNGVLFHGGAPTPDELTEQEGRYKSGEYYISNMNDRTYWGQFVIDGNAIRYERPRHSGGGSLPVYIYTGEIINDTTFVMKSSQRVNGDQRKNYEQIFHFKEFSPKPDSTNQYIK